MYRYLILILILFSPVPDGPKEGRTGNKQYHGGEYQQAAASYRSGLERHKKETDLAAYGLRNNLGASLYRLGDYTSARQSFLDALAHSSSLQDSARASYNAGNAAFKTQDLEAARDYYRRSLLSDPNNEDARYNYELASRRLKQQQQQQKQNSKGGSSGQKDQQKQQQNQQNQNQDQQQNQPGSEDQKQSPDQQQNQEPQQAEAQQPKNQMSQQQAERILQALENEEQDLQRQARKLKAPARTVDKDW